MSKLLVPGAATPLRGTTMLPMDAAAALFAKPDAETAQAIVAGLSQQVFEGTMPTPSNAVRKLLSRVVYRALGRTTRSELKTLPCGSEVTVFRNRLLERAGHPYARALLEPTSAGSETFVEGGDPMNGPYMMLLPELRANGGRWDRLLMDSLLGRDVQLRFINETRAAYAAASARLAVAGEVRLKAVAAGTGLSMILVYDRLIAGGADPSRVSATFSDADPSNTAKTKSLLAALPTTASHATDQPGTPGVCAITEDAFEPGAGGIDVVTLVGILEYFLGHTGSTTEGLRGFEPEGDADAAPRLVRAVAEGITPGGHLIANSYRPLLGARVIEHFGKRLRYRLPSNLHDLMAAADLEHVETAGSGHVYDVEIYRK